MDYNDLCRYTPIDFTASENEEYIKYHQSAIELNSNNNLHNFAYLAWHILFMAYLQKVVFILYKKDPETILVLIDNANARRVLQSANTPYDLSELPEKQLCRVLGHHIIGFHRNKISNIIALIDDRDHVAHCSGIIDRQPEDLEHNIRLSLRYAKEIQEKLKPIIFNDLWKPFLNDLTKGGTYTLITDSVGEFLRVNYLSVADIEHIVKHQDIKAKTYTQNVALLPLVSRLKQVEYTELDYDYLDKRSSEITDLKYSKEEKTQLKDELIAIGA